MITTNISSPECNFWEELVTKVAEIGKRTREKAHTSRPLGQRSMQTRKLTRFEVQESFHRSQEETLAISNRIKYLEVDRERHHRTLELVKRKYERMIEIRQKSLKQKEEFRKKITIQQQEMSQEIAGKVSRIREERSRTSKSVQRVKQKNQIQAKGIRVWEETINESIRRQRHLQVQQKRIMVQKAHEDVERSRFRLNKIQQDRIQLGKVQHKQYIRKRMEVNRQQHRKNSLLRHKLEQSIVLASMDKEARTNKLKQYQTVIAPSPRNLQEQDSISLKSSH